jgi:hypothetical protein
MAIILEQFRVNIPEDVIIFRGKADIFFDFLPNSQNLTEEFLYAHQPTTNSTIPVFSTSETMIAKLDDSKEIRGEFNVINGPVMIVARKGYAGRLYVVEEPNLIVHEDAYPVKPRQEYDEHINLWWFAGHYSAEFQSNRTSFWGIGDFPRERFKSMDVIIPARKFQNDIAGLYIRRSNILSKINKLQNGIANKIASIYAEAN